MQVTCLLDKLSRGQIGASRGYPCSCGAAAASFESKDTAGLVVYWEKFWLSQAGATLNSFDNQPSLGEK